MRGEALSPGKQVGVLAGPGDGAALLIHAEKGGHGRRPAVFLQPGRKRFSREPAARAVLEVPFEQQIASGLAPLHQGRAVSGGAPGKKQLTHSLFQRHVRQQLLGPEETQLLRGGFRFRLRFGFRLGVRLGQGGGQALCFTGNRLRLFQPQAAACSAQGQCQAQKYHCQSFHRFLPLQKTGAQKARRQLFVSIAPGNPGFPWSSAGDYRSAGGIFGDGPDARQAGPLCGIMLAVGQQRPLLVIKVKADAAPLAVPHRKFREGQRLRRGQGLVLHRGPGMPPDPFDGGQSFLCHVIKF